jgi:glycosyltransferase involved in cell wall biosynthesis
VDQNSGARERMSRPAGCAPSEPEEKATRVAMVIYNFWPGPEGGAERQCRRLGVALLRRGCECRIFTTRQDSNWPARETHEGLDIVRLPCLPSPRPRPVPSPAEGPPAPAAPFRGGQAWRRWAADALAGGNVTAFIAGLTGALWRYRPDVIHVHIAASIAGYCAWLGGRWGTPVVVKESSFPAIPPLEPCVPFSRTWDRWRRRANFVALNSMTAADLVGKGVAEDRVTVIPNGVEIPAETGGQGGPGAVLYVGNFSQPGHDKAFDVLIEAWAIASRQCPQARLRLVGGGDHQPWLRRAKTLGCGGTVEFTGFARRMDEHYRWASLLLLPSRREGMSNALLEAQSWGIPAVVSDIPGNRAVVVDGVNGRLAPVGDAQGLADLAVELLRQPDRLRGMGERARAIIESGYSVDCVAGQVEALYRRLIARGKGKV